MPLRAYGVLRGRPIDRRLASDGNPHYQVHVVAGDSEYRLAINVSSTLDPPDLLYLIDPHFEHAILSQIPELAPGWHPLASRPGGLALDFVRSDLFRPEDMTPLPFNAIGPDNDLNDKLDQYLQRAMADERALLYAFGVRWGPERKRDKIFRFTPGNGVHDIHMNQGNAGRFVDDDGVYQDGALLLRFPSQEQWVGIFLKFQSQSWHTDDRTGHRLETVPEPARALGIEGFSPVGSSPAAAG